MALELPGPLANVLEGLGYHWTNTDEGGLSAMGDSWVNFSGKPQTHAATANAHVQNVLSANQGQGIDGIHTTWGQNDAAHRNLTDGGTGAALIGAGLQICAGIVAFLKVSMILQLVQLVIDIFLAIMEAFATFGASMLEIPIFKELTQKALGLIQNTAINAVIASA
jgi:hypothetical protein